MRYQAQLERLREKKIAHTRAKLEARGHADTDDYGWVLAPEGFDWGLPADGWHGAAAWGRVFRGVMERHPVYLDADDALAGRWMLVLTQQRPYPASPNRAPFPFDYPHLVGEQELYDIISGIGADNHFGPDYKIGLELGWGGLKAKAEASLARHAGDGEAEELLLAELDAVAGVQDWIARTAAEAARRADA
ncbi:MAG: hypothetical protein LBL01_07130, partial [Bifidobacteriaceae bacterium]|nr:hypothetical protein [Bifidobacteriaceae bacterium]